MKKSLLLLCLLYGLQSIVALQKNQTVKNAKGTIKLLGQIDKSGLTKAPFNEWFQKNYNDYIVNTPLTNTYKNDLKDYKIKVFLGTWCGDSKQEVPRFYKAIEAMNFSTENLEVIAVDRIPEAYKQSPTGEEKGLNIHRVPTFIFYKDGKEVNRIVERPKATFERDIHAIVKGSYSPNYIVAGYLEGMIATSGLNVLKTQETQLIEKLSEYVKGSRELNTYGYVNLRAGNNEKAIYIFNLNTKLFPYKANTFDSLGEAYFESKDYKNALKNFNKALTLKPNHKNAIKMIDKIKVAMK